MTNFEMWEMIVGSGGFLGIIVGIMLLVFRTGRIVEKINIISEKVTNNEEKMKILDEKLDSLKKEVKEDVKRLQSDISDIKERVSFMEAFMFFSEFKSESNNSRSETMKEVWKRRKTKQVESSVKGEK